MIESVRNVFSIPELKKKILMTVGILAVYRIGFAIPIPGVNFGAFLENLGAGSQGGIAGILGAVTGAAMTGGSLFSLGIMPYISASIIFSLLQKVVPALEEMAKEGESGQKRINQYARYVTVLLCVVQSFWVIGTWPQYDLVSPEALTPMFYFIAILSMTAGTIFVMWLGEQISEKGIGNGISLLIMAGIVARMPAAMGLILNQYFGGESANVAMGTVVLLGFAVAFMVIVAGTVFITQGQRRIPVQHAKHVRGRKVAGGTRSYMPLKVNHAGVMPVIFASPLLLFLGMLFSGIGLPGMAAQFQNGTGYLWALSFVGLIFFFSYFWTGLYFNPEETAKNIKEYGSFIPGIRPGKKTAEYMQKIMNRITLAGAAFLTAIAMLPSIIFAATNISQFVTGFLGGTGLLIVVGVSLDLVQTIESHLLMRHYDGFMGAGAGAIRGRRAR